MLKAALQKLVLGEDLSEKEACISAQEILQDADPHQVAAFLALLRAKGETGEEIAGMAQAMRSLMVSFDVGKDVLDIAGTGGDGKNSVNISTAASILAASCGVKTVKHGNGSATSRSGSADLLNAFGIDIEMSVEKAKRCLSEIGITFCFAPIYHPLMAKIKTIRSSLKIPTVFNLLGTLTNPAENSYILLGVFREDLLPVMRDALLRMNLKKALLVHSCGYDELTTVGPSQAIEITPNGARAFTIDPKEFGFSYCRPEELQGGSPEENAEKIIAVFKGKEGGLADTLVLNAAAALYVYGKTASLEEGILLAKKQLQEGKAFALLQSWIQFSKQDFLQEIAVHKREEVERLKKELPSLLVAEVLAGRKNERAGSFKARLLKDQYPLIAEIKHASPSKGKLMEKRDPFALASTYMQGGASAISIVTDSYAFEGKKEEIEPLKLHVEGALPFLQKDFFLDPIQLVESLLLGADAALLIVTLLQKETHNMVQLAKTIGLDVIVEVKNEEEVKIAVEAGAEIIMINSRDLQSLRMDQGAFLRLLPLLPKDRVKIAASGISSPEEAAALFQAGFDAVLIGEILIKEKDPASWIMRAKAAAQGLTYADKGAVCL